MSEFKGTPGPWSVPHFASDDVSCECGYVFSESQSGFGAVASVPFGGENESYEQAKANAKLIAAAPELLKALEALTEDRLFYIEGDTSGQMNVTVAAYEAARAAIAKATA